MKRFYNEFIELEGDIRYVDSETNGLSSDRYKIWSVQIGDGVNSTIITFPDESEEARTYLKSVIEGKLSVAHNMKFDIIVLWKLGIKVDRVWCTRIMEDIMNVGKNYDPSLKGVLKKYKLAELSKEIRGDFYLDEDGKPALDSGKPTLFELSGKLWTPELIDYAFEDIEYLPEVYRIQNERIEREGVDQLAKVENSFVKTAAGIEYFGTRMNLQQAFLFQAEMLETAKQKEAIVVPKLEQYFFKAAKEKFDVDFRIYSAWEAKWEEVKKDTNKMRDGSKLNAEAARLRGIQQESKPFRCKPKLPVEFNLGSNQQLLMALQEAGVELESTGKNELLEKAVEHPVLAELLEFRKYEKLSQMLEITDKVSSVDGRIHPHVTQIISTGRQAMSKPNLQQIPVKTEEGKRFRRLFQPADGNVFVSADYSAIELVIAGVLAGDKKLVYAIKNEPDLHCYTISQLIGIPSDVLIAIRKGKEVYPVVMQEFLAARDKFNHDFYLPDLISKTDPKEWLDTLRDYIKTITYGLIYGLSIFGLMEKFHCIMQVAEDFTKAFFSVYSGLKELMDYNQEYAEKYMRTTPTPMGRIRYFQRPPYVTKDAVRALVDSGEHSLEERDFLIAQKFRELQKKFNSSMNRIKRQAGNFTMQASSADMTKYASVLFERKHPVPFSPAKLILTVHDEIIVECPADMAEQVQADLKWAMEKSAATILSMEGLVVVETKVGTFWDK